MTGVGMLILGCMLLNCSSPEIRDIEPKLEQRLYAKTLLTEHLFS